MVSPFVRIGAVAVAAASAVRRRRGFRPGHEAGAGGRPPPGRAARRSRRGRSNSISSHCKRPGPKSAARTQPDEGSLPTSATSVRPPDQPPTLAVAVYQVTGEDKRIVRVLLPLGLLLRPGFRLLLDKSDPIDGQFAICFRTAASARPS